MAEKPILTAADMIDRYGNQAYHRAVEFVVIAANVDDRQGAKLFAGIAHVLMAQGFHKVPKQPAATER